MTPKLVKIYIKRDNTVRRLTSWKFILCWADHLHVTVYIRKSQKYAVKNIINIGSSKKLLHGYGIYLSLHTRYKPQHFVCLRKRGMLHVHVHQECIIVLVAYVEIISTSGLTTVISRRRNNAKYSCSIAHFRKKKK